MSSVKWNEAIRLQVFEFIFTRIFSTNNTRNNIAVLSLTLDLRSGSDTALEQQEQLHGGGRVSRGISAGDLLLAHFL